MRVHHQIGNGHHEEAELYNSRCSISQLVAQSALFLDFLSQSEKDRRGTDAAGNHKRPVFVQEKQCFIVDKSIACHTKEALQIVPCFMKSVGSEQNPK